MKKKIGILGGISAASTAQYYMSFIHKYYELKKDYYFPEIIIYSLDFQKFTDLENSADKKAYIDYTASGLKALERAGADILLMAANSAHSIFDDVKEQVTKPMVSIVEAAANFAVEKQLKKVLLLGIKHTMNADFYPEVFSNRDIEMLTPNSAEKEKIEKIIFDELSLNIFKNETRQELLNIIERYPVNGVVLGCTELPLILKQSHSSKIFIDTLSIHVDMAIKKL